MRTLNLLSHDVAFTEVSSTQSQLEMYFIWTTQIAMRMIYASNKLYLNRLHTATNLI